jgi:hypothetical protein
MQSPRLKLHGRYGAVPPPPPPPPPPRRRRLHHHLHRPHLLPGRPVINTGNNSQSLGTNWNYLAIRGLNWSPGNVSGPVVQVIGGGGATTNYLLIENNILAHTQLSTGVGDDVVKAKHHIIRGNSVYETWHSSANAHGIFASGIVSLTVEYNVIFRPGWNGVDREANMAVGGTVGNEIFRHGLYQQVNADAIIRYNLIAEACATGLSSRGPQLTYGNVLLKCPIHMNTGGGDNFNVHRPNGVLMNIGYNLCLGNQYTSTAIREGGINTANGRLGTQVHHNAVARSIATVNGITFSTNSNLGLPSYSHTHHNREHLWANSGNNFTISEIGGGTSIPTYDNNISSDPTGSGNTNYLSDPPTTAYTEDNLAAAGGYTDYATLMAYAIAHPEAHVATVLFPIGAAGYEIDLTNIATPGELFDVALDATTFTLGSPTSGQVLGVLPGTTLAVTGLPSGLMIDLELLQWHWSGVGSAGSWTVHFTQTNSLTTNSGKTTDVGVTIS